MYDLIRDSFVGQLTRVLTRRRLLRYPEEASEYELPRQYSLKHASVSTQNSGAPVSPASDSNNGSGNEAGDIEAPSEKRNASDNDMSTPIIKDGYTIVTWYSEDDPENPYNWGFAKKMWVSLLLLIYTFAVYIGSSVYTASIPDITTEIFHVSEVAASLGLSMYVIGYGFGPMLWSPLSEIPAVGRTLPYALTTILFVILCVPTALVNNFGGLLVLRLLLGFFGSPCLATAGASYGDFWAGQQMPYVIALWGGGATLGPALGPVIGGFAVEAENWRWSTWELLWLTGPTLLFMLISLPETSSDTILHRRAHRLRQLTGRTDLRAESEIKQSQMKPREITFFALIKPWEINAKDPAVLFSTVYTALTYGIYYSFFESFPIVYQGTYGFDLGELGLAFLAVLCGLLTAVTVYCAYFYYIADPWMAKRHPSTIPPEARLWPGLIATFLIPIGLFIFAWTSRPDIHWIVSMIGVGISMCGVFIITQCMFIYLPFTYPKYAGSLFAANGFARAMFAAGAILYALPMFHNLGVGPGVSLLAALTSACVVGIYCLYFFGASLRKRSKFAVS